jgi:Nucleoside-diphosphate-sugar epimerases
MKILITGANGFIGKNLISELKNRGYTDLFCYDTDTDKALLDQFCTECEFVFHLAGINRPKTEEEYMDGNYGFTSALLDLLKKHHNPAPILVTSSVQAAYYNPYGQSKKAGEELLSAYSRETGTEVYIYRLPGVFGKWCRPNYNSVIATFCHNIANDLPIQVNDPAFVIRLVYIDDVVKEFLSALAGKAWKEGAYCQVNPIYSAALGDIAELVTAFQKEREEKGLPDLSDAFTRKLYATYLSYLPVSCLSRSLTMNKDSRGSFTEFIRTPDRGQISVNISAPGITRGNHWHHTKCEKFLVVNGMGIIKFRKIDNREVTSYYVSGDQLEVVDIPPGYTHCITNTGTSDMVTIIWASEQFDGEKPDTYFLEVENAKIEADDNTWNTSGDH